MKFAKIKPQEERMKWAVATTVSTVYAIYFTYRYFRDFGLGWGIREGLFSQFL